MPELADLARRRFADAQAADHRRLIVLHGAQRATHDAAAELIGALALDPEAGEGVLVGDEDVPGIDLERVPLDRVAGLLGTTQWVLVLDAHDALDPDVVGRTVGTVDGGGLYVLLAPPLEAWPEVRDAFDAHLAVPPFSVDDVEGRFRRRLVATLERHKGIAIVDADTRTIEDDGEVDPARPSEHAPRPPAAPHEPRFPTEAYEACLTRDQADALAALERLADPGTATVIEADRGRGKSSAAGLAAGALLAEERDVVATAPRYRNASELFARARELLDTLGIPATWDDQAHRLETTQGARLAYQAPADLAEHAPRADAMLVDEAAGLPVWLLTRIAQLPPPVAYVTTIHGYEGAGRGFSVRFKGALEASERDVSTFEMQDPIRYAPGDPLEAWAFHALMLDARPAADPLVEDATPDTTTYRRIDPEDLIDDDSLLGEVFGLLVLAHYRTSPSDLARLLDAPNLHLRALLYEGHIASVALLAREGSLPEALRREIYEGGWIAGNMIPDVLTSQLRDEDAGATAGLRVMRIATHPAVRSRGLGSRLLEAAHDEFDVDWFGVGYGATPELVRFWARNRYRTIHLATSRNETSGEHSAIMLNPRTDDGHALLERASQGFAERIEPVLSDALSELDPDVVRHALAATDATIQLEGALPERAWRHATACAYGPGVFDVDPGPMRRLALEHLVEPDVELDARAERLLVKKVLQAQALDRVTDELGYVSRRMCMRALGDAYKPLVDRYGGEVAKREKERYLD